MSRNNICGLHSANDRMAKMPNVIANSSTDRPTDRAAERHHSTTRDGQLSLVK